MLVNLTPVTQVTLSHTIPLKIHTIFPCLLKTIFILKLTKYMLKALLFWNGKNTIF